jgi:hypothetical protein
MSEQSYCPISGCGSEASILIDGPLTLKLCWKHKEAWKYSDQRVKCFDHLGQFYGLYHVGEHKIEGALTESVEERIIRITREIVAGPLYQRGMRK